MNTKELLNSLALDLIPQHMAVLVDFGMDVAHCKDITSLFGAYQTGIKHNLFTKEELNAALGDGEALTKLVNRGNNNYGKGLIVHTAWDDMPEEEE